ncbi:MAG: plasmid pRiA4b ORF-3 family protein [Gammaproteobacteria bacterium]|jgi:hypothetical protein
MKIYSIKIALRGISPMVWRRLRIPGNTTIADFHHIIQTAYSWDNEYLHQFHIYGKDYGISYCGGISFADDAHSIYIDDFEFDVGDKFTYEYNFFEHNLVDIRIENIKEITSLVTQKNDAYCISGAGIPGVDKYAKMDVELKILRFLTKPRQLIKVEHIRVLVEELNAVSFNRKKINLHLAKRP